MFFKNKEGIVNLDHVFFVRKDFLFRDKKYVIIWQFNSGVGYTTWKYETEKERDEDFALIELQLFDPKTALS